MASATPDRNRDGSGELLSSRVRGEYLEMPGLRLTLEQACRLWQLDSGTCEAVLRNLTTEGFLYRTQDGAYMSLPASRGHRRQLKASLPVGMERRRA